MDATAINDGRTIPYTPSGAAVAAGAIVLLGTRLGIAINDIADGALGTLAIEGNFSMPKATGEAWTLGASLYWDNTNKKLTTTSSGNTLNSIATKAAASGDTTGEAKINAK